jgi:hypothetical protein
LSLPRRNIPLALLAACLAAAACAFLLLPPTAQARSASVVWAAPTKADQTHFTLSTGNALVVKLTASTAKPGTAVTIQPITGLPKGATVTSSRGAVAHALLRWTPGVTGEYVIRFGTTGSGASAPALTYIFDVQPKSDLHYPRTYALQDNRIAHWAPVIKRVAVHLKPTNSARVITTLAPNNASNIVLVLSGLDLSATKTWYRVRLAILPNNSTGWVESNALGDLTTVHTHLYIDQAKLKATLKRDGHVVFSSIIGVGRPYWPTPRGEFYIRDKFTNFANPFYGPVAFLTSARSAVLTDWPGGGFVGVHGTNEPAILPGRVSHGCIRMRNESILKLAQLMQTGTPLTIR